MRLAQESVTSLMTPQPVSVERDTPLDRVLAVFGRYPFRHLPVVGGNQVVGILSDRDVLLATGWLTDQERTVDDDTPSPHTVVDIMSTPVRTLSPAATVGEAARVLLVERIGALPVVDEIGLLGILTETDLLQALHDSREIADSRLTAAEVMQGEVLTALPEEDLLSAAERLFFSRIRHMPVVEGGRVVAILSDRDVRLGLARLSWQDNRIEHEGDASVPSLQVRDVMTDRPFTIAPDSRLTTAIACMLEERLGALPVVQDDELVGIVSRSDLLRLFLADAVTTAP